MAYVDGQRRGRGGNDGARRGPVSDHAHPSHRHRSIPPPELGDRRRVGPWAHRRARTSKSATAAASGPRVTLEQQRAAGRRGVASARASLLGGDPQDIKYRGEETWVEVGAGHGDPGVRHHQSRHHGYADATVVGAQLLPHDLRRTSRTTARSATASSIANATQMAGHVTVQDHAIISGLNADSPVRHHRRATRSSAAGPASTRTCRPT